MSTTSIGLPTLTLRFQAAAQKAANRSKRGFVGVMVRDTKAQGVHVMTSEALIPTELGAANRAYITRAFTGSDRGTPSKVVAVVIPPTGDGVLEAGLKALESQSLDYLAPPSDVTETECTAIVTWVKGQRAKYRTVKAVLPNTAANDRGIINFAEEPLTVGNTEVAAAAYCSRIAGILAGIPSDSSCTYAALPEVTAVAERTVAEQTAAINAGKLILLHDGQKAKIARGVNSLTTIPAEGKEDWRKIKIVEGMDLITYYLRTTIEDEYIGQYANVYDNKCVLLTAIKEYLFYLESVGVLSPGTSFAQIDVAAQQKWLMAQNVDTSAMTEQEVKEADTGSWVFVRAGGRFVDAMEDFEINFSNL